MTTPTYQELVTLNKYTASGLTPEDPSGRILTCLAIIASGQNPDGTSAAPIGGALQSPVRITGVAPTLAWGPAAGVPFGVLNNANSNVGNIQFSTNTGTAPVPGILVTLTFASAFNVAPMCVVSMINFATNLPVSIAVSAVSATSITFSTTVAIGNPAGPFQIDYLMFATS